MTDKSPKNEIPVKTFVTGWPIGHSRSPIIHGYWLITHNIAGSYEPVAIHPEEFARFHAEMARSGYAGGNVTLPHKEMAFELTEIKTPTAEKLGAVNTLWFEEIDGEHRLCGDNTDAYGFAANLDQLAPGWDEQNQTAIILGAGGAARAVVHVLQQRNFNSIHIINRTISRAEYLASHFNPPDKKTCIAHGWEDLPDLLADTNILINTTSLGMAGKGGEADDVPFDIGLLPDTALVTDIVYVPLQTPLLKMAKTRGLKTVDGLGMLLHQAVPGFERWYGVRPKVTDALRQLVLDDMDKS